MSRVLVLRPEPGANATAERSRQCGLEPILVPLFKLEPIIWEAPKQSTFDALLLTSANAVRMGGSRLDRLRDLPVYAVGEATAEAARSAGFDIADVGDDGVEHLLCSIDPDLKLLHLCGEDRREPQVARQRVTPITVYRARAIEAPDLSMAEGAVVLVHSPRAGRRLSELVKNRRSIAIAAISPAAAATVGSGWARVESADAPTDEALLALAARLCNKSPPE